MVAIFSAFVSREAFDDSGRETKRILGKAHSRPHSETGRWRAGEMKLEGWIDIDNEAYLDYGHNK